MGRKKTYGIFNKHAQKVEKSSKNKVETVLPDTLYSKEIELINKLKDLDVYRTH